MNVKAGSPLLEESLFMHIPVEWVFEAFTEPRHLTKWLGRDAYVIGRPGGEYWIGASTAGAGQDDVVWWHGEVQVWGEPDELAVTWPVGAFERGDRLHIKATPGLGGAQVTLRLTVGPEGSARSPTGEGLEELWGGALEKIGAYFARLGR